MTTTAPQPTETKQLPSGRVVAIAGPVIDVEFPPHALPEINGAVETDVALEGGTVTITAEVAQQHYAEHDGKPFFGELVAFITRSPVLVMVVEGPEDTYKVVRTLMGTTNPVEAAPGTIRGDLALETGENLVHGSDSPESAEREIALFFPGL